MVDFIKNSANYGFYIVEESPGTDDWLDDHDHIKELDWDEVTPGEDGIFIPYSGKLEVMPEFIFDIMDFFKGAGADMSLGEGHWMLKAEGRFPGTSEATRNTFIEQFIKLYFDHLTAGDKKLYLGYRMVGEIWHPFINDSGSIKYYLPGKLTSIPYTREGMQNYYNWKIVFRGVF